jgi:hypothetical protein
MNNDPQPAIAYFISAHGFGHAARAAAVMEAVHRTNPAVRFEIFTTVPRWFFEDSLAVPLGWHACETDVGLVQTHPLKEDLPATLKALEAFYPLDHQVVRTLTASVKDLGCRLVICDIAPLGIAVARQAGVPSVLIENFTWDWIYAGYTNFTDRLAPFITCLGDLFIGADYHIQAEPVCAPGKPDLAVAPISRRPRLATGDLRRRLGVPDGKKFVVLTLGGTATASGPFRPGVLPDDFFLVIPSGSDEIARAGRVVRLPVRSDIYHPDLIRAADAVIGKAGYSTLAEIYQADVPFGYVSRTDFREAPVLETFVQDNLRSLKIAAADMENGSWTAVIPELTALPSHAGKRANGAGRTAQFVLDVLTE